MLAIATEAPVMEPIDEFEPPYDPEANRLRCCSCGADLGPADDPYRDPSCRRCDSDV